MSPGPRLQTTTDVEISAKLRQVIASKLEDYLSLQIAIKELQAQSDTLKAGVVMVFEEAGEGTALDAGVVVEGKGRVKMVYGTTSKLDPKKLITQGVSVAQIEQATVTKPSMPYLKISPPGRDTGSGD